MGWSPINLRQHRLNGLHPSLRSSWTGVQQIPHQVGIDRAVGTQENMVHVQPKHLFAIGQLRGEFTGAATGLDALVR